MFIVRNAICLRMYLRLESVAVGSFAKANGIIESLKFVFNYTNNED